MKTIDAQMIDFDAYLKGPDEAANIKSASDWAQAVIDRMYSDSLAVIGKSLPWKKTGSNFRIRPGEVTLWPGTNGHGKSVVIGQIMLDLMAKGERVCIASMEMSPVATMERICRQAAGEAMPKIKYIRELHKWTDGKLWLYDQHGTVKAERILTVMRYCHEELKITQFVIDSLMKCGMDEDDYNGQKRFIDQICAHAKDTGMHVHLVAHSRKGKDEMSAPGKMDVKGTGAITDQVDNVMTVWRNKQKEADLLNGKTTDDQQPDTMIICDKQRHYAWEGRIGLWFDKESFQFTENPYDRPETLQINDDGFTSSVEMVEL